MWRREDWSCLKTFTVHSDSVWDLRLHGDLVVSIYENEGGHRPDNIKGNKWLSSDHFEWELGGMGGGGEGA